MNLGKKLLGKRIFDSFMRNTFYGQFIAGENPKEVLKLVNKLKMYGVNSVPNYSSEGDLANEMYANKQQPIDFPSLKTKICEKYFNKGERQFDMNLSNYLDSIQFASGMFLINGL